MVTALPTRVVVGGSVMMLPPTLAVLNDDPGPPVAVVHVFAVASLSAPVFNNEP
jgi:hypothetical protein